MPPTKKKIQDEFTSGEINLTIVEDGNCGELYFAGDKIQERFTGGKINLTLALLKDGICGKIFFPGDSVSGKIYQLIGMILIGAMR